MLIGVFANESFTIATPFHHQAWPIYAFLRSILVWKASHASAAPLTNVIRVRPYSLIQLEARDILPVSYIARKHANYKASRVREPLAKTNPNTLRRARA